MLQRLIPVFSKYLHIVSKIKVRVPWFYGLIGKGTCWSYFCYMSMGVREWLRWWVAFLGGLLLCQERYWALQEYAHFGLYNRQITKLSEWPMLEWTLSTTSTALHNGRIKGQWISEANFLALISPQNEQNYFWFLPYPLRWVKSNK